MESEGFSPPEASSESMPEIVEDTEFELDPVETEATDALEAASESPEADTTGEFVESYIVPEPVEEDFPLDSVESEYGAARDKESLAEKEPGSDVKPSGVGDPAAAEAAEDQALFDEVQQLREEQERELQEDVDAFDNREKPPYAE